MSLTVISTGYLAPTKSKCLASVAMQTQDHTHLYIEASEQDPPLASQENYRDAILSLPDDEIVCLVDGDDWLAHPEALSIVHNTHASGAWATYGSYVFADGRPGIAARYAPETNVRTAPWRATHLKTFRAGLYKRINQDDFAELAHDMPLMFAVLEMAGTRAVFIPEVLYVYNYVSSFEFNAHEDGLAAERLADKRARAITPYPRLLRL